MKVPGENYEHGRAVHQLLKGGGSVKGRGKKKITMSLTHTNLVLLLSRGNRRGEGKRESLGPFGREKLQYLRGW